jgi:hypothetical protein
MTVAPLHVGGLTLWPVRFDSLDVAWPQAEPWVRDAVKRGARVETVESYREQCADRTAQLWMMIEGGQAIGCGITAIFDTAQGQTCEVSVASAERIDAITCLIDVVGQWAKAEGCVRLEINGRDGWRKPLKEHGFRVVSVCLGKDL